MPVTGLRGRYFLITSAVLLVVTTASVYLYTVFLRRERLAFIDQQVRETATALVDSQLGDLRKIDFDEADSIISDELGDSRIGKFFIIRNSAGETVYESTSASLLPITDVPEDRQWFEITSNGKYIRGLNLKLPRINDRTLQVGLVLDDSLVNPSFFSSRSLVILALIFCLGILSSYVLTSFLLRPIARLGDFLVEVAAASRKHLQLPSVPSSIAPSADVSSRDEFVRVVAGLNGLIQKVNRNHSLSRLWSYQMAHELKTPLSVAAIEVERLQQRSGLSPAEFHTIVHEHRQISETVNSFLGWAELENSVARKNLHLINLSEITRQVAAKMPGAEGRILFERMDAPIVLSNPLHLEQLLQNLLQNALIHSTTGSPVLVRIHGEVLEIEDTGPGIPNVVLERLGEPFNRGTQPKDPPSKKGHGLGLALVASLCRMYDWAVSFCKTPTGNTVRIKFLIMDERPLESKQV